MHLAEIPIVGKLQNVRLVLLVIESDDDGWKKSNKMVTGLAHAHSQCRSSPSNPVAFTLHAREENEHIACRWPQQSCRSLPTGCPKRQRNGWLYSLRQD